MFDSDEGMCGFVICVAVAVCLVMGMRAVYRANVTVPLEMADKGYCWGPTGYLNGQPLMNYAPCRPVQAEAGK